MPIHSLSISIKILSTGSRVTKFSDWHIPLASRDITLQATLADLQRVRAGLSASELKEYEETVLTSKFASLNLPELANFKKIENGSRDCMHIMLGRGFMRMDDIFVSGLTLGSIRKVIDTEQGLNALVVRHLVPDVCDFDENETMVFRDAIRLAYISNCSPLDQFDYMEWLDHPLAVMRDAIGIEPELLNAYYELEKRRNPENPASQRLLPPEQKIVAF